MIKALSGSAEQQINLPRFLSWAQKGGFAVLDQASFAGGNFVVNILLARWLPAEQYGAFVLAFSIFLFISGFHNALLLEPMTVLGPVHYKGHLKEYLGSLIWIHGGLSLGLAVLLLVIAGTMSLLIAQTPFMNALFGVAVALPLILLLWLLRRAFYLERNPKGSLIGSCLYCSLLIVGLIVLKGLDVVSLLAAFVLMAVASAAASCHLLCRLKPRFRQGYKYVNPRPISVLAENWRYGKWVVAITVVYWLSGNVYYLFTAGFLGFEETGALRALENVVLPVTHIMTALGLLLLPWASGRLSDKGLDALRGDVSKITVMMTGLVGAYFLGVFVLGDRLIGLLYGDKYAAFVWLLPYLAAVPLISAIGSGWRVGLRAVQAPWAVFVAYCVSATVTVSLGAGFVHLWGLQGAVIGSLLSVASQVPVVVLYWRRIINCENQKVPV
jgi:O-antigen/teichoic acid export membrane protein